MSVWLLEAKIMSAVQDQNEKKLFLFRMNIRHHICDSSVTVTAVPNAHAKLKQFSLSSLILSTEY